MKVAARTFGVGPDREFAVGETDNKNFLVSIGFAEFAVEDLGIHDTFDYYAMVKNAVEVSIAGSNLNLWYELRARDNDFWVVARHTDNDILFCKSVGMQHVPVKNEVTGEESDSFEPMIHIYRLHWMYE